MTDSIGEALPREMSRVRDEIMPAYQEIGPPGMFALAMMRKSLDEAQKAMIEGDLPAMIRCYADLREYSL